MKLILKIGIIFSLTWLQGRVVAQNQRYHALKFSGKIFIDGKSCNYDSLYVTFNKLDGINPGENDQIYPSIKKDGNFKFSLPDLNKPYKIFIGTNTFNNHRLFNEDFFTEPNDRIKIIVDSAGLMKFYGPGSFKYNLTLKLKAQFWKNYYPELKELNFGQLKDSLQIANELKKLTMLVLKFKNKKKGLINSTKLSLVAKKVLNYEYARYSTDWVFRIWQSFLNNVSFRKQILDYYLQHKIEIDDRIEPQIKYCPLYLSGISQNNIYEFMMLRNVDKTYISMYYTSLKLKYEGYFRDRLLERCLFGSASLSLFKPISLITMDSLLRDAKKYVKIPALKQVIDAKLSELSQKNKKIYPASFFTINGQKFDLDSLRGKVFLIDTWFRGCWACAQFHKAYEEEIYPHFKDNKNFVCLSVNIDKNRNNWLKGIDDNRYTSKRNINVFTGDEVGLNHPFFKHYKVKGSPYLMLVNSEGTICFQPDVATAEDWRKQIIGALNKLQK